MHKVRTTMSIGVKIVKVKKPNVPRYSIILYVPSLAGNAVESS